MTYETIICRSRKAHDCLHGQPVGLIMGVGAQLNEDGTWDGSSVVCDACYLAIGAPSVPANDLRAHKFGSSLEQGDG